MNYKQSVHYILFYFFCFLFSLKSFSQNKPLSNPKKITFKNETSYGFTVSYDKVDDAEFYLVLCSEKSIPLDVPKDGVSYLKGDQLYGSKVMYQGRDTFFTPKAIRAGHHYYFSIFTFNGSNGTEKYQTSNPAYNSILIKGLQIGSYYEEVNSNAPNFSAQLHDLISKHNVIPYYNYKTTLLEDVELNDTSKGMRYIECVYTNDKKVFSGNFDWTQTGYSREHTFAHSWMPTYPANNPEKPEYSDLFNLYPTNLDKANSVRSNYPFGEINGKVLFEFKNGRLGEMNGQVVYEPSNHQKGNVARAIFYMLTAYNSSENNWLLPSKQNEEILKKWHFQDLPDGYEITRQEYIYAKQGNRNPFIDSVDFVCKIDFYNMLYTKNKCLLELPNYMGKNHGLFCHDFENKTIEIKDNEIQKPLLYSIQGDLLLELPKKTKVQIDTYGLLILKFEINGHLFVYKIVN